MLLPATLYQPIRDGSVTLAFRSWKRPTVRAGGTLLTGAGLLAIDAVDPVDPASITGEEAAAAGAGSLAELLGWLRDAPDRRVYRVRFRHLGEDPRTALREDDALDAAALDQLAARLARLDAASRTGPWTGGVLDAIAASPGVVSTELADRLGSERMLLKRRIRQLKALGLTESLVVGYRLSPRGEAYRAARPAPAPGDQENTSLT